MGSGFIFQLTLRVFLFYLISAVAAAQGGGGAGGRELWCVAKNNADDSALQAALDWACGPGGANCGPIQKGGPCFDASDLQRTASFAFNDYFIKHGNSDDSCNFSNTAAVTSLNPSHNSCKFPSSLNAASGNLNGSATTGYNADLSGCSSITHHHWYLGPVLIHLLVSIVQIFHR